MIMSTTPPSLDNPVRIVNFPVGKRIISIFQQGLGNDPHDLIFPEMVGLVQRLSGNAVCMCMEVGCVG